MMAHVTKFQQIPMSKSMRGLCKEEDFEFLGKSNKNAKEGREAAMTLENDWIDKKEERVRRRLEREQQEEEKVREIEESRKAKEQQWQTHIAELTSSQEKTLQGRLDRLRQFRAFQRKVLQEEAEMENEADGVTHS